MSLSKSTQSVIKALRDSGVIPAECADALLPAKRRKVALCMNRSGSARRPEGACSAPVARLYEADFDGKWRNAGTLCEKCLGNADLMSLYTDPTLYKVVLL